MTKAEQLDRLHVLLELAEQTINSVEKPPPARGPRLSVNSDYLWVKPELGAGFRATGLSLLREAFGASHAHSKTSTRARRTRTS